MSGYTVLKDKQKYISSTQTGGIILGAFRMNNKDAQYELNLKL